MILTINSIANDAHNPLGLFFQDNVPSQMESLEELYNNIMFYSAIILFAVSWIMLPIILNKKKFSIFKNIIKTKILAISADFIIIFLICNYIINCSNEMLFSLESLATISVLILIGFIFTFISKNIDYYNINKTNLIDLVIFNLPYLLCMLACMFTISYLNKHDVFIFYKDIIKMSTSACYLLNYLVFLLPYAITQQLVCSLYFGDKDFNCDIWHNLYVVIYKAIYGIKVENFLIFTIFVVFLTIIFTAPMWFKLILYSIACLIIAYIKERYEITKNLRLQATNSIPLMALAYFSLATIQELADSLELTDKLNLEKLEYATNDNRFGDIFTEELVKEIGYSIKDHKAYPPTILNEEFKAKASWFNLVFNRPLIQITEDQTQITEDKTQTQGKFLTKYKLDSLLNRYIERVNGIDYCLKLDDATLVVEPKVLENINTEIENVKANPNSEPSVKGLIHQLISNSIFQYFLITPEWRTKTGQVMDYLVEHDHNKVRTPLCCVEVKATNGHTWLDLISQGRRYAVDVCEDKNLDSVFVLCAKGTKIAFFVYQHKFMNWQFEQNYFKHKNMIGIVLDNKGFVIPMPQIDRLFTQFQVLDLANPDKLRVAQVLGKYISNRLTAPLVGKFSTDSAEYWAFRQDLNFVSNEYIEIAHDYFRDRDAVWKRVWNLHRDHLIKNDSQVYTENTQQNLNKMTEIANYKSTSKKMFTDFKNRPFVLHRG